MLKLIFCEEESAEPLDLSDKEMKILTMILKRKKGKRKYDMLILLNRETRVNEVKEFLSGQMERLREEMTRMVFTFCFKHLVQGCAGGRRRKYEVENAFYNHYFSRMADEKNLIIDDFILPISNRSFIHANSVKKNYLSLVFQSKIFMDDFLQYLRKGLLQDFLRDVQKKITACIAKLQRESLDQVSLEEAYDYFLMDKKVKLPWTVNDIIYSIKQLLKVLRDHFPEEPQLADSPELIN